MEAVWKELKEAVVGCAEQHLQSRRQPQRQWLSTDTMELVERNTRSLHNGRNSIQVWRDDGEYLTLCKQVRRAIRAD